MSFKAASSHQDRFVVKAEVGVPRNSAIEDNSVMNGNIRTQNSVTDDKEQENCKFSVGGREDQPQKVNKFCLDK